MPTEEDIAKAAADTASASADSDAKPVTMADLKAFFSKDIPTLVNSAVATHTKRLKGDFEKQIAALKPKPAEGDGGEGDEQTIVEQPKPKVVHKDAAKPEERATQSNPELDALRKELARVQRKQEQAELSAKAEARKRVELEGHQTFKAALVGKVAVGSEDVVLAALKGRNALVIADDGAVRLKLGTRDEPDEGLELSEGVKTYLTFPEAKFFIPAPNAGPAAKKPIGSLPQRTTSATPPNAEEAFENKFGKSIADVI